MACNLAAFDAELTQQCTGGFRAAVQGAHTFEEAAVAACRFLYDELRTPDGGRACPLVRCYKTHEIGALPPDIAAVARRAYGRIAFTPPEPNLKCLTLMATVGDEPSWNDRRQSRGHQAIPLPSPEVIDRAPMIAQLIRELGVDLAQVVRSPDRVVYESEDRSLGIFHVENALRSRYIPAQDFVERYAIRSVVGFGGMLPPGHDIFAFILFARIPISYDTADHFRRLASEATPILSAFGPAAAFGEQGERGEGSAHLRTRARSPLG